MYSVESLKRRSRHFSEGGIQKSAYNEDQLPSIRLQLQGNELIYENGIWSVNGNSGIKSMANSNNGQPMDKKKLDALQRENDELKFKVETLLDILTTTKLDLIEALGSQ
eukprot:NODE_209_length_14693_cov_0.335617.p10 type:complete len:109 gc:universal NODE_209_length_14693_cov_0.335617:4379-4053(-)